MSSACDIDQNSTRQPLTARRSRARKLPLRRRQTDDKEDDVKVKDIMTAQPATCAPYSNLAEAAELMLDADCGMLPVIEGGKLVGVVTDRDMFIALATRDARPSDLTVGQVAGTRVFTCEPDDDVHAVLATMKQHRVRRLPVEGFGHTVVGIVSMNDILLAAGPRKAVRNDDVVDTFQSICAHHHPTPHVTTP
jgi:CBS domain-containing protein